MRSLWSHKANQPRRKSSTVRRLVTLFVSLLVFGTALVLNGLPVLAATSWTTTPSTLTAGDANCPMNADGSWACSITLGNPNVAGPAVSWSSRFGAKNYHSGVSFTPSSGILSGGETTPIKINIARSASTCQNGYFQFLELGHLILAQATWACTYVPVVMTVSPTSLSPDIQYSSDPHCAANVCTVTLANPVYSTDGFSWTATSDFRTSIQPFSGTLSPNESTPVTLTFNLTNHPAGSCDGIVTFTGTSLPGGGGKAPPNPAPVTVTAGPCTPS